MCRHCLRQTRSKGAKRRSNPELSYPCSGLLRGACHRARIRAIRWLAMTVANPHFVDCSFGRTLRVCVANLRHPPPKSAVVVGGLLFGAPVQAANPRHT